MQVLQRARTLGGACDEDVEGRHQAGLAVGRRCNRVYAHTRPPARCAVAVGMQRMLAVSTPGTRSSCPLQHCSAGAAKAPSSSPAALLAHAGRPDVLAAHGCMLSAAAACWVRVTAAGVQDCCQVWYWGNDEVLWAARAM